MDLKAWFLIAWLFIASIAANQDPYYYSLSQDDLRDLIPESDYDSEEAEAYGHQIHSFFRESNSQLILDLDIFAQFWKELDEARAAATDGNVDYIREIINFLEPLQKHDISAPCLADIFHFLWTTYKYAQTANQAKTCDDCNCTAEYKEIFKEYQWIFNVVDAIGKLPAAVTGGNNLWVGSWSTCRKISTVKNAQGQFWNGQYCLARFYVHEKNSPLKAFGPKTDPSEVCRSNYSQSFEDWSPQDQACFDIMPLLNVGFCMPDTCTDYDFKKIVEYFYTFAESSINKKLVCDLKVQCSNDRAENKLYSNLPSMAVLCFCITIFSLMIYGTCYDYYVVIPAREKQEIFKRQVSYLSQGSNFIRYFPMEPDAPFIGDGTKPKESKFVNLLMMFSIRRNTEQLMNTRTQDDQINCLHGARFLSMCWIIFGHTYYYICTSFTTDNLIHTLRKFPKIFYNQLVVQAPLAVDSFFFLSGLLTTYIFIKKLKFAKERERQTKKRATIRLDNPSIWIAYYVRRYIRLTPIYLVIMILNVTLFTYVSDGPFWRPIEPNYCKTSWWVNLLYLNNFIKQDDQCMGWTWYMANDFQLHCFAPILIIALYKFKKLGIAFAALLITVSCSIGLAITIVNGYPPAPILSSSLEIVYVLNSYWEDVYVKPYIRCVPYIIGSVVGYLLNTKPIVTGDFKLTGAKLFGVWTLASCLGIYSVFGLWHYTKTGEISYAWHLLYTVFGRLSFSIFLGWTIFACQTGHADKINRILGHKFFVPLSKMTFCAYLIHPILLQLYYLSRNTAFHFTHAFQMFHMFLVAVFVSYAVAFILCLAFEQPVTNFDKLLFQDTRPRPRGRREEEEPEGDGNEIEMREPPQPSGASASRLEVPDRPLIHGGTPPSALKKTNL